VSPAAAWGCPACFATSQAGVLKAFYLSTAALTLLPFAVIGGVVFSIYRLRQRERRRASAG